MAVDGRKSSAEREQTDESLRTEREKTDRALVERQAAVEGEADEVVQRARENADDVLIAARDKADDRRAEAGPASIGSVALVEERLAEDEALRVERATADESLRREREDNARALAKLFPLEREKTDRFLLTERVRSDDSLANRDDFLAIVSHDLRNLLGGIVMSASLLAQSAHEDEEGAKTLVGTNRIQRYAARMNRLIGDLLDVASIDAGRLAIAPTLVDATSVIAEAVDTFRPTAAAKGISLVSERVEPGLIAEFDHDRILQVLANLVTNSIKFTGQGGSISIRGERAGDDLHFSVSDTGMGIPEKMLEAVFERFWQVGKNDRRGVGLGLYISKCIVEAHGGRIWAESVHGEGTTLRFTLPIAGPPAVATA